MRRYAVDSVHFVDELASVLEGAVAKEGGGKPGPLHLLNGVNTDRCGLCSRYVLHVLAEIIVNQGPCTFIVA
jgi:hypothetical protein